MSKIFLYSPIPPLKTGTAHYFDLFMNQLGGNKNDFVIVVDRKFYKQPELLNYKVIDYTKVKKKPTDVSIYFLANNEYHRYCHFSLYHHKPNEGSAISVVHEPAMWMNIYAMCSLNEYGFSQSDLNYFSRYEFGTDAEFLVEQAINGRTEYNFDYVSLAGTHIYEKSDVVVFHSHFAKNKFIAEKSPTYNCSRTRDPKYLIMEHPPEHISGINELGKKEVFVVGTYGWVKKTKLIEPIIKAFNSFYETLPDDDKAKVRLDVVGEIDETKHFRPKSLAGSLSSSKSINFYGYVSNTEMNRLMAESFVMFALRFPSCGETSGPVYKAKKLKTALVLSEYAAFAEQPASHYVTVNPSHIEGEILEVLVREFNQFKAGKDPTKATLSQDVKYITVKDMLVEVSSLRDNGMQ